MKYTIYNGFVFYFNILLLFIFCEDIPAQEIKWENISAGIQSQLILPEGEMNEYWQNSYSFGAVINYKINNNSSLEGGFGIANFKSAVNKIPSFTLFEISGGINFHIVFFHFIEPNLTLGLQSNTFEFEIELENNNESEFGFFISPGFNFILYKNLSAGFFYKYQAILSKPEIYIDYLGVKIFYNI